MPNIASTFQNGITANEAVDLVRQAHQRLGERLHRPLRDSDRTDVHQVSTALSEVLQRDGGLPADEATAAAERIVQTWRESMVGARDFQDYVARYRNRAGGNGALQFEPQNLHFPDSTRRQSAPAAPARPPAAAEPLPQKQQQTMMTGVRAAHQTNAAAPAGPAEVVSRVQAIFGRIDHDRDGELSEDELKTALRSSAFRGEDAAAVATLLNRYADIARGHDDGEWFSRNITLADVGAMGSGSRAQSYANRFNGYMATIRQTSAQPFPNGVSDIRPGHVVQQELGDCYFMAALSSLARTRPQAIQQMISDNGNGTFTVRFPGQNPVTVDSPTDGEVAMYGNSSGHGRWVTILEKAYAELDHSQSWIPHGDHPQDSIGNGGLTWTGIERLSPRGSTAYVFGGDIPAAVMGAIASGQNTHRMMVANISPSLLGRETVTTDSGVSLPTGHVYEVVGFTDSSMDTVRIRNPWGTGGPRGDGTYDLPWDDFRDVFQAVAVERQ